ncbi:MAG TPA: aconitate hydratase AcnA [Oligoflexia bacterium]|nr:aconitate hydratase AcnA [Oligoflexia bacterium]HMP48347.1 aconitate hydratase AcnA [Oligoflexia bacterium]
MHKKRDDFGAKSKITSKAGTFNYYSLKSLEKIGSLTRLPYSIRILLESALRNFDGFAFSESHLKEIISWNPKASGRNEIPYKPARVVLQDFTGVPAIVDLAAMRDCMKKLGKPADKINPLVRCDLVIDHSVQVDHAGRADALKLNEALEFKRNKERYEFLKWGQSAFRNLRVVPPSTGIVHQVNLEYLSEGVYLNRETGEVYPDSCVGTDSHTPMVNGLGVLAWGVGGIEAEAVMLDQPLYLLLPDVIGIKLDGALQEGVTATDLVLAITEMCRKIGVVDKFVEFFGPGLNELSVSDRSTIGNMAPEQGSTVSFFPIDEMTLDYLRFTGRPDEMVDLTERYSKEQGLFRHSDSPDPEFTQVVTLDLSSIEPALAGPKRPHDRVLLKDIAETFPSVLSAPVGPRGFGLKDEELNKTAKVIWEDREEEISNGSVVIAAITSCTNTSNPSVMLAAGLVAKKAVEKGLTVKKFVKTSLAPGSTVVTEYLSKSGLLPYMEKLGFHVVGYGCTTCIGNSGPLATEVEKAIKDSNLVAAAVLSGNRNFEGRINPATRANYLASPPLVVAYALAGNIGKDLYKEPIGSGNDGKPVYLKDIWPSQNEIQETVKTFVTPEMFREKYADVFRGSKAWEEITTDQSELYSWDEESTYIQHPPFFEGMTLDETSVSTIENARALAVFMDSVTTDHISPAGNIAKNSPAARYLDSCGVAIEDYNSYGSRRGNDRVMVRGTFANIRIKNQLLPGSEGNITLHHPSGEQLSFFDAAEKYKSEKTQLIILAGKEYGSGSSRDWAAKGPYLQGVKAVIAESFERIHRSNLLGMGIIPLQFKNGDCVSSLGLKGTESFSILLDNNMSPGDEISVTAKNLEDGTEKIFSVKSRIDTLVELTYFKDGGILRTVLKNLANE